MRRRNAFCLLAFSVLAVVVAVSGTSPVDAATQCTIKTASGTGPNEKVARFQVYEGLLRSADTSLWSAWMTTGETPGYRVSKPSTICRWNMGLGVSCRGRASICKL
jgi:hypothetical protein